MIPSRVLQALLLILVAALALRAGARLWFGEQEFWNDSYSAFYDMAENIEQGKGFCFDGLDCGYWPPVYPFLLSLTTPREKAFPRILVMQSVFGAATAACAFLIGAELFGNTTGLLAALLTGFYPYFVRHDTALQETGTFTFLTTVSMVFILKVRKSPSVWLSLASGAVLGTAILTRATLAPFALAVTPVFLLRDVAPLRTRQTNAALFLLGVLIVLTPWLVATYRMTGIATLTSQSGEFLWKAHNPETFSHYPTESIDLSTAQAWDRMSARDHEDLNRIENDEAATNAWFLRKGLEYIETHPGETATDALRKIEAGFSFRLNPRQGGLADAVYTASYTPVLILAAMGIWWTAARWREFLPIYLLVGCFVVVTAVFWAHTSHRSYLDVYMIVFASEALRTLWLRWTPGMSVSETK